MSQRVLEVLRWLRGIFSDDRLSLALSRHFEADDELSLLQLEWLANEAGIPLVPRTNRGATRANGSRCRMW